MIPPLHLLSKLQIYFTLFRSYSVNLFHGSHETCFTYANLHAPVRFCILRKVVLVAATLQQMLLASVVLLATLVLPGKLSAR